MEEKKLVDEIKEILKQLKDNKKLGYKGVIYNYPQKKLRRSKIKYLSILISLILSCFSFFHCNDVRSLLIDFNNLIISVFPNLLGFTLGGYALIIGFGNNKLLKKFTVKSTDSQNSLFQKINSVFAYAIIIQTVTLGSSVIIFLINKLGLKSIFHAYINSFGLFIISFLTFYSLFLLYKMVINIFDFGQLHHFDLLSQRLKEKQEILKSEKNISDFY